MKILCVSDQIDPLVYSNKIKERFGNVDAVLCAGDLPSDYIDFIVSSLNKPTYFIFGNHNLSEFGYYHKLKTNNRGPHPTLQEEHSIFDMKGSFGGTYVGFKVIRDKHLKIKDKNAKETPFLVAGASGSIRYNNGLNQYTDFKMKLHLIKMIPGLLYNKLRYGRYCDIFLTHASPRHIHDKEDPCHKGFECFNWFIRKFQPKYLVHGHIHLYDMNTPRITVSHKTTVINAYSYVIIELNDENKNGETANE
ncbi:MAG: metallophosphoesterase [Treponema sp.]|nr:metallophosphoesterase [Candidatus Treponema equifaecale]